MEASLFYLLLFGGGIAAAALTGVGATVPRFIMKRRRAKESRERFIPAKDSQLPKSIDLEVDGLRKDIEVLLSMDEMFLAETVGTIVRYTQELFGKLRKRGDQHQIDMAAISYGHVLATLNATLSDDYFFDMVRQPDHWIGVEAKRATVREAAIAIRDDLLNAIRSFNASADMEFEVNLEHVLQGRNADALLHDLKGRS